jgi:hypothetical protein
VRDHGPARASPESPEVEQDHLAAVVAELELDAFGVLGDDVGRLAADLQVLDLEQGPGSLGAEIFVLGQLGDALQVGLADGTVDAVATDLAPHTAAEKAKGFVEGPFGVIGLETAFAALLTFVEGGLITPLRASELMTAGPARVLGRTGQIGTFAGACGDVVVVDPRREDNAMREAKRMNVPVVCVLDTDCDPSLADIVIPANDDAMSSVQLILGKLSEAVMEGRKQCDEMTLRDAQRTASDDVRNRQAPGRRADGRDGGGRGGRDGGRRGGPGGPGGRRGGPGGGGPGGGGPGGGGRFQAGGHAGSVSIGSERPEAGAAPAAPAAPQG